MLALHHLALAVRLTRLDLLAPAAGVVELQAELRGGGGVRAGQGWVERAAGRAFLGFSEDKQRDAPHPRAGFSCRAKGQELLPLTLRTFHVPSST